MKTQRIFIAIILILNGLSVYSKPKAGEPGDKNIRYFGRWDFTQKDEYASYWGGAYLTTRFSGTTIKIKVGNKTNYYAKIDNGPWVSYLGASGIIDLTPQPLVNGVHRLTVAQGKDYNYEFKFDGLLLDEGAKTLKPDTSPNLIEWIGDSITTGYTDAQANVSDYAWICSDSLHCEHTQIAYPGINLVSGYPHNGMDQEYFKEKSLAYLDAASWDFQRYTPKLIVINLGTNDTNHKIADSLFQKVYTDFLVKIRAKYPKAQIFAMKTFCKTKVGATSEAVKSRNDAGDKAVHYIDTMDWLTETDDFTDHTHPSIKGHIKAAKHLMEILSPYLNAK